MTTTTLVCLSLSCLAASPASAGSVPLETQAGRVPGQHGERGVHLAIARRTPLLVTSQPAAVYFSPLIDS